MSMTENQTLELRDLAVTVAKTKGVIIAPNLYTYQDPRIRIEYSSGKPHTLTGETDNMQNGRPASLELFKLGDAASRDAKVLSVIWNDDDDAVVVLHRTGSWEDSLRRLAKAC